MDTKLKKGKKIRALFYRTLAAGALFTVICSAIIGRDALTNLVEEGPGTLTGDIYYLSEFREYITTLYMQGLIGYAGLGDNNGYPLTTLSAKTMSQQAITDFRANATAAGDELIYRIDVDTTPNKYISQNKDKSELSNKIGLVKESGNLTYPLFSEHDGHLLLPSDTTLCCYWNGYSNTLTFLAPKHLERFNATQLYKPNEENSSHVRLLLAIKNKENYTSEKLAPMSAKAKGYQRILFVFFGSCILLVAAFLLSLLSWRGASAAKADFAVRSVKLWLEVKLLALALLMLLLFSQGLFKFIHPVFTGHSFYGSPLLYFPAGCILYLLYTDLKGNKTAVLVHSLTYSLGRFIRSYLVGKPWQRRMHNICIIMLFSILAALGGGSWILYVHAQKFIKGYYTPMTFLLLGILFLAIGILLIPAYIRLKHFLRDTFALTQGLDILKTGEAHKQLTLPKDSLLTQAAAALNALDDGIEAAVEQQNRSNRMRVELITNVSHDLKTPLTSIINYADLLCEENLPAPACEYAVSLQGKAYRLKSMVQDVFELSKATSGNLPVEKTTLDLAKLLRQTLADMDEQIAESTLTFKLNIASEPVMIEADGEKLYRVFQNLIVNALRYSLENSRVHIQLTTEDGYAYAKIKNTSRQELDFDPEEIVERFVRADTSRTTEGSGLGLSIVQSFTEACGGSFHIDIDTDMFTACVCFPVTIQP